MPTVHTRSTSFERFGNPRFRGFCRVHCQDSNERKSCRIKTRTKGEKLAIPLYIQPRARKVDLGVEEGVTASKKISKFFGITVLFKIGSFPNRAARGCVRLRLHPFPCLLFSSCIAEISLILIKDTGSSKFYSRFDIYRLAV